MLLHHSSCSIRTLAERLDMSYYTTDRYDSGSRQGGLLVNGLVFVLSFIMSAVLAVIIAVPVFFLWNWLMPGIFGLGDITLSQAWGLTWLLSLLFPHCGVTKSRR